MSGELHIASLVLRFLPARADALMPAVAAIAGVEIALRGEGKLVVLCEAPSTGALSRIVAELEAVDGVINVGLVYHHAEARDALLAPLPGTPAAAEGA